MVSMKVSKQHYIYKSYQMLLLSVTCLKMKSLKQDWNLNVIFPLLIMSIVYVIPSRDRVHVQFHQSNFHVSKVCRQMLYVGRECSEVNFIVPNVFSCNFLTFQFNERCRYADSRLLWWKALRHQQFLVFEPCCVCSSDSAKQLTILTLILSFDY